MRESFIIYKSFIEAGEQIKNKNERLLYYEAIFNFALSEKETELKGVGKVMFTLVKPQLQANLKKYKDGCKGGEFGSKGGRPNNPYRGLENNPIPLSGENPTITPNENENENENENDNENDGSASPPLLSVLEFRGEYDKEYKEAKWEICKTEKIEHTKFHIMQNAFDSFLISKGKVSKDLIDYADHFKNWVHRKTREQRIEIFQKVITPKKEQSIHEKYS